jgi:hypothetical protein
VGGTTSPVATDEIAKTRINFLDEIMVLLAAEMAENGSYYC